MNLDPSIWGPAFWTTLHNIASGYDKTPSSSKQLVMKNFIQSIPVFLMCKECQDHAFEYIKSSDLDNVVNGKINLFIFFFDFHNEVNLRLKKPLMKLSKALKLYHIPQHEQNDYFTKNSKASNDLNELNVSQKAPNDLMFIFIGIVVFLMVVVVLKNR